MEAASKARPTFAIRFAIAWSPPREVAEPTGAELRRSRPAEAPQKEAALHQEVAGVERGGSLCRSSREAQQKQRREACLRQVADPLHSRGRQRRLDFFR